jgi:mRNA-degrading endonuclease RelE of RelBE toxin-antitoxin system
MSNPGGPRPEGKRYKLLRPPVAVYGHVAECRLGIGDWRVPYDIDDARRRVYLISLRRRSENTYR